MSDLNKLFEHLIQSDIDFVIVGGFAAVIHGGTQVTRDLDVCVAFSPEQVHKIRSAFCDFNPKYRLTPQKLSFLECPEDTKGIKNLYLETDLGAVDFLSEIKGVGDFNRVRANSITVNIFGHDCLVLDIDALIKAKKAMGSLKDKLTVQELEAIKLKKNLG